LDKISCEQINNLIITYGAIAQKFESGEVGKYFQGNGARALA
jgi:hypothetical protein